MKKKTFNLSQGLRLAWIPKDFPTLSTKQLVNLIAISALFSASDREDYHYKIKPALIQLRKNMVPDIGKTVLETIDYILFDNQQESVSVWDRYSDVEKKKIRNEAIAQLRQIMQEIVEQNPST
jgi:hypothetical protein